MPNPEANFYDLKKKIKTAELIALDAIIDPLGIQLVVSGMVVE